MSVLNVDDFQRLQDQLVELRTRNYDLESKYSAALTQLESLRKQLEEQESNFRQINTILRGEIDSLSNPISSHITIQDEYKSKYKTLKIKTKEYRSQMQQLDGQNKDLNERLVLVSEDNSNLNRQRDDLAARLSLIEIQHNELLECNGNLRNQIETLSKFHAERLKENTNECETIKKENEKLKAEINNFESRQIQERKIQEKRGLQIVRELKRQLVLERKRAEVLQQRLQEVLITSQPSPLESESVVKHKSEDNYEPNNHSVLSNDKNRSTKNLENDSVSSWSFLQASINNALAESLSMCSINSGDQSIIQTNKGNSSEESSQHNSSNRALHVIPTIDTSMPAPISDSSQIPFYPKPKHEDDVSLFNPMKDGQFIEEQAALVNRVTQLQQEKWHLEEKSSYLEQVNASLIQELADKTDLIKDYFMSQAAKTIYRNGGPSNASHILPSAQQLSDNSRQKLAHNDTTKHILEKASVKRVVDFLREHSHIPMNSDSDNIKTEALIQMQKMLEETMIKLNTVTKSQTANRRPVEVVDK